MIKMCLSVCVKKEKIRETENRQEKYESFYGCSGRCCRSLSDESNCSVHALPIKS